LGKLREKNTQIKASFRAKCLKKGQKLRETQGKFFERSCLNPVLAFKKSYWKWSGLVWFERKL